MPNISPAVGEGASTGPLIEISGKLITLPAWPKAVKLQRGR